MKKVLFACGGTGGHVYPALAIADSIHSMGNYEIAFAGRSNSMEARLIGNRWKFFPLLAVPLVRGSIIQNLTLPWTLTRSLWSAYRVMRKVQPDLVVATGGYVSLPIQVVAGLKGLPVYLQEQNAVAGVANRIGSRFARKIFVTSPDAAQFFPAEKCSIQGNPIRSLPQPGSLAVPSEFANAEFRILVLGGSQGGRGINRKVGAFLSKIAEHQNISLVWQVGAKNIDAIRKEFTIPSNVTVAGFLDPVYAYMDYADLLISRAGASTLAEILAFGKPSVLMPFPFATANHQEHNARVLEKAGAALVELDDEPDQLWTKVESLINNISNLETMAKAAKQLGMPDAADRIAHEILQGEKLV